MKLWNCRLMPLLLALASQPTIKTSVTGMLTSKRSSVTVNAQFETSQEGVYAIGDAAEYEGKIDLIAVGMGEAPIAINQAIQYIDPDGKNRPVHSTSLIEE